MPVEPASGEVIWVRELFALKAAVVVWPKPFVVVRRLSCASKVPDVSWPFGSVAFRTRILLASDAFNDHQLISFPVARPKGGTTSGPFVDTLKAGAEGASAIDVWGPA